MDDEVERSSAVARLGIMVLAGALALSGVLPPALDPLGLYWSVGLGLGLFFVFTAILQAVFLTTGILTPRSTYLGANPIGLADRLREDPALSLETVMITKISGAVEAIQRNEQVFAALSKRRKVSLITLIIGVAMLLFTLVLSRGVGMIA